MTETPMKKTQPPPGWHHERVCSLLAHYESQSEDEAVAEDEAAFQSPARTVTEAPAEPTPGVRWPPAGQKAA